MEEKYSILIVDDETEILNMLSRYLNRTGKYTVSTYSNPLVALDTYKTEKFDLVLLDIMMPQLNGLEALERMMDINNEQKVVMMTAYSTLDKVLKSHKVGATNYLMKPFESLQILEKKVDEVLKS